MVPVRREPSDTSEMVTQLLFGEHFEIFERKDPWRRIRIAHDGYEGWIDSKQMIMISDDEARAIQQTPSHITLDLVQIVIYNQTQMIPVVSGSTLPRYKDKKFKIGETEYSFDGTVRLSSSPDKKMIIENAFMYINSPYLWGGRSPFGIDCSGFTQLVFKLNGIELLRDAWQQALNGKPLDFVEEAQPGDLAFFDNDRGKIIHVGIILGKNKIIHASGKVRIDKLDHYGIYNEEKKAYTHQLRIIRAML